MKRWIVVVVASALLGGCVVLEGKVRYEDLDQLVHRATGKHLHDRFSAEDFARVRDKAWGADLGDLIRITDHTEKLVAEGKLDPSAERLTTTQQKRVRINLQIALARVLDPVTEMRKSEAKREMVKGGCTTRMSVAESPGC
jgi:hypothetical protein